jgi:hypothetical protein
MITHHRDQGKVQCGLRGCDLLKAVDDAELHEGGWGRRGSRNSKGEGSSGAAGEGLWPDGVGHMMGSSKSTSVEQDITGGVQSGDWSLTQFCTL